MALVDLKMAEPAWDMSVLTRVAKVLADTADGLTGSQIGELLAGLDMGDPGAGITKWRRLHEAFVRRQKRDGHPQRIITFITWAMSPANYIDAPKLFTLRQDRLNEALTFVSLRVNDKGQVARGAHSTTLDEASPRPADGQDGDSECGPRSAVRPYRRAKGGVLDRLLHAAVLLTRRPTLVAPLARAGSAISTTIACCRTQRVGPASLPGLPPHCRQTASQAACVGSGGCAVGLLGTCRSRRVLQNLLRCLGSPWVTGQSPRHERYTRCASCAAPRPTPHLRRAPSTGGCARYAGVEVSGAQHLYVDTDVTATTSPKRTAAR